MNYATIAITINLFNITSSLGIFWESLPDLLMYMLPTMIMCWLYTNWYQFFRKSFENPMASDQRSLLNRVSYGLALFDKKDECLMVNEPLKTILFNQCDIETLGQTKILMKLSSSNNNNLFTKLDTVQHIERID